MTFLSVPMAGWPKPAMVRDLAKGPLPRAWLLSNLRPLLLAAALWLGAPSVQAAPSDCLASAAAWIAAIDSPKAELLLNHAQTRCDFAARWLLQNQHTVDSASYHDLCQSLVLVWTHKECVYFRDEVDHRAYNPCQTWSRIMYKRCLADDRQWFLPTSSP